MPILDRQARLRELGRIRIGQQVQGKGGKTRPEKLDKFRLTSPSRQLIDRVAALYGGTPQEWTPPGGVKQWEVITETARVPVLVPPRGSLTQNYELWSGGGCERRCDGMDEVFSGGACVCGPDPAERECSPVTRLSVMLRDVEGLGVWRLESHGWNAASELPELVQFLASGNQYMPAFLELQQRQVKKRDEKYPRNFAVPVLDIEVSPGALLAQGPPVAAVEAAPAPALEASAEPTTDEDSVVRAVWACTSKQELRALWRERGLGEMGPQVADAVAAKVAEFDADDAAWTATGAAVEADAGDDSERTELDALWMQIIQAAPEGWSSAELERAVAAHIGVAVEKADAAALTEALAFVRGAA